MLPFINFIHTSYCILSPLYCSSAGGMKRWGLRATILSSYAELDAGQNACITTKTPMFYTACYAMAVLVCPCVCVKLHFHIKLVIRFIFFSVCVARVSYFIFFFLNVGEKFWNSTLGLALQALWQSFGYSTGSWGFGNVLANALAIT